MILGFGSAVIDNVPLVAAAIGMFQEAIDASVWHLLLSQQEQEEVCLLLVLLQG